MGASPGPVFIVGSNGSGSTLLRLMLDSHPNIAIPEETGFLRLAAMHRWVPYWKLGGEWYGNLGLTEDQLTTELAGFYGGLFSSYAVSRGKQRWGDKTPFHVWHLELARRMYPTATFVGIVRHPGGVVASLQRRFSRSRRASIRHWMRSNRQLLVAGAGLGDRFVLVRYEDLVAEPEPVMRALLARLGEAWSPAVLAHHEVQPARRSTGFTRTDRAVDTSSVARWEDDLPAAARARVAARTGPLARFLGYDPARSEPTEPLGTESPILTGTELADRQRTRGQGLDWQPPRPRAEDRVLRPPSPRRRRRGAPDLDQVTIRKLVAHRMRRQR
ncbi:MAG TPA: sulfotransferase [Mycobacteriales bacterium]|nr:sulfotransferase [Mycobacteriales bacterium]